MFYKITLCDTICGVPKRVGACMGLDSRRPPRVITFILMLVKHENEKNYTIFSEEDTVVTKYSR